MPFVQRVVQPVNIAQVVNNHSITSVSAKIDTKFHCIPGKCSNNNCINKQNQQQQHEQLSLNEERNCIESIKREHENGFGELTASTSRPILLNAKDTIQQQKQQPETLTKALIHTPLINGDSIEHNQTNGFASSFTYVTDNEEDLTLTNLKLSTTTPTLPMKKLKQHVEFLSTAPSPSRNHSRSADSRSTTNRCNDAQQRRRTASAPQSPTASKIVSGYEFDSISNITLSNALRQLASLVLIASDIFDNLQKELQTVGDRARVVQRKIITVEQCVSAYDPKMVTVPESDLLTFAQRKNHYQCDKSVKEGLFTAESRPHSVRQLYEDAGKITPPPRTAIASLQGTQHSPLSINGTDDVTRVVDITDTSVTGNAAGSDELVCTPVFGRANRTMRTRIDAEIEIRLPAAIEDLRKWTSSEALGDVTVTPDCMHHVDTSICTSMIIGDNGVLTPALSPSVLSADAVDALYSINVSNINENIPIPNDINKDVPLNHRLPSPEEQCKIIALRYPAEIISVDTSGKRFQRMCLARKSTTGCYTSQMAEANNLNDDVQTVSRRSRSRKVRGKRRNTIAGIDQKEIQDAANGDTTTTSGEIKNTLAVSNAANGAEDTKRSSSNNDKTKKFGRSKSSDILKKESVALPYDKGKSTLTRLNSLKQWGRNRFKFMQRSEQPLEDILDTSGSSEQSGADKIETNNNGQGSGKNAATTSTAIISLTTTSSSSTTSNIAKRDIDDECVVHELISQKSESRFSHERKPSYSSSEKSMSVSSTGHLRGKLHLTTCGGNVKLRDTASLNRQRRNGISTNVFGGKDEQPHSSSGNWSASSESGRASIGSEITIQPKSSASNTSLNVSSFHPGSGPPSSMLSRRRFMNTSASSSVTSEGTATPDLQVVDGAYPNHMDDETSSAYSCDTEGYYTSFHMDSGLRTLKEEEPPITPLQTTQNLHTSNYSFGSQSNQTVLTAENEYELFGRGSTSTTTSSAGTVCTTLMINGEQNSLSSQGPDVPERISSLSKLNRSSHSNSASTSTLERSYSSSTIGSTLERTGTIKRNTNASLKLATNEVSLLDDEDDDDDNQKTAIDTPESQDTEFDYEHRIRKRAAQPLPQSVAASLVAAEMEYSESSDLECVERIERIKQKTTLNAKRIPSMCIITPTTSDDENHTRDGSTSSTTSTYDPNKTLTNESSKASNNVEATNNELTNMYSSHVDHQSQHVAEVPATSCRKSITDKDYNLNQLKRTQTPLNNMIEKFKVVLPNIKRSPSKTTTTVTATTFENKTLAMVDDDLYADVGEYVYITDISNNNHRNQLQPPKAVGASGLGIYYSNDIIRRRKEDNELQNNQQKQQQQKHGQQGNTRETTEYISLNELPLHLRRHGNAVAATLYNQQSYNKQSNSNTVESEVEKLTRQSTNCADAMQTTKTNTTTTTTTTATTLTAAYVESSLVPMYAEISELREEKTLLSPLSQQKGARVRLNAQGKIIYESDSLKRRKGAHTTFAPGPYVKETESALFSDITTTSIPTTTKATLHNSDASNGSESTTKTAKLLLLNGGVAATRKIANVRPIVATSPLTRVQPIIDSANKINMSSIQVDQHQQSSYQEQKQILANQTNPFFQNSLGMMPSPSTKSTSSTGSTVSSTPSTLTTSSSNSSSSNASASSREEGYQRFYKISDRPQQQHKQQLPKQTVINYQQSKAPDSAMTNDASAFQRNAPVYWTLQNRRQAKPMANSATTSRDDLYATPIKRSERIARAAAASVITAEAETVGQVSPVANGKLQNNISHNNNSSHIYSPIIPRNRSGAFSTSTPHRNTADATDKAQWDSPERLNICADRIGQSKTSLMDFKKLLLAKSAKSSPVQRKVSAVELLKKANAQASPATVTTLNSCIVAAENNAKSTATSTATTLQPLNSSMKLLDLSGSPKTFANRRMLRQGQFGSPSKTFASKNKPTPSSNWRSNSVQLRTDIMSTAIPEATNSEEDPSNSSGSGTSNSSRASSIVGDCSLTAAEKFDLKRNFFLQTDENNFMRGELKKNFGRNTNNDNNCANNKLTANTLPINSDATSQLTADIRAAASTTTAQMPALETAL